jgi:hypothetical protein
VSTPTRQRSTGLLKPTWLFIIAAILIAAGWSINFFYAREGILRLEAGKAKTLVTDEAAHKNDTTASKDLGFIITLDSLSIRRHTPAFEIKLWKRDSMPANPHAQQSSAPKALVGAFPLEPMKINKIEDTDLRFRLKAFYPNFEFAYEYPADRDTIKPKAPGITLELRTKEGTPIVTLRTDQPGKHTLRDIVSLGASLAYYWELPADSLNAIASETHKTGNKILFSGADNKVFFVFDGLIEEKKLEEKMFYNMPGQDSTGFTILYSFPDAGLLKAVPSSRGTEVLNPVAHVEIWKEGEGYRDAFIYPETRARISGGFDIPGSSYKLGIGTVKESEIKFCDCVVSIQKDSTHAPVILSFLAGKSQNYQGYRFSPTECLNGSPGILTMQISRKPGKTLLMFGFIIASMAVLLLFIKK